MNKFKKLAIGLALAPAAVFAEGESSVTTVGGAVTSLQGAATDAISAVTPAVLAVLTALFVIVGVVFAYRQIKRHLGR